MATAEEVEAAFARIAESLEEVEGSNLSSELQAARDRSATLGG